jgi:hypothetical protein
VSLRLPPELAWVEVRDGKLLVYHLEEVAGCGVNGILIPLGVGSD